MSDLHIDPTQPDPLIPYHLVAPAATARIWVDRLTGVIATIKPDHDDDECMTCDPDDELDEPDASRWPDPKPVHDLDKLEQWAASDGLRRSS